MECGVSQINRKNYDLFARFVHEQGISTRRVKLQGLSAKEAFELKHPLSLVHPVAYDF